MTQVCVLGARVRDHVAAHPDRIAYAFHRRHDDTAEELTWRELWREASACAAGLAALGSGPGRGVLIFCDDARAFVISLLAVWMTGATAIPATGGLNPHVAERNRHIVASACPDIVLHDIPAAKKAILRDLAPSAAQVTVVEAAADGGSSSLERERFAARLLQFTSGSTARPKPVLLAPETLAAGCQAIETAFAPDRDSIALHWLPLYHDMGLIGAVVQPLFSGFTSVLLRPAIFIQRPLRWVELVAAWQATITSAPNFAYARLCAAAEAGLPDGLDLGSLRTVIFGGEPVLKHTVGRLLEIFGPVGLSPAAIAPCYGMAEVTLLASSGQCSAPAFSDLNSHETVANLGPVVGELAVTIRDPATGASCPEGAVGDIWLEGPAAGRVIEEDGDWRDPGTRHPIQTGDIGFLLDGAIHVTGRTSNRIILQGRNVYAEDVEALVVGSQPHGTIDGVAAIGLHDGGTQSLCVLVEMADRDIRLDIAALNLRLGSVLGVRPNRVVPLRRASLPRTSSGKIRRSVARENYLAGRYAALEVADVT